MRIAVAGGTGTVGRPTVEAVRAAGHEAVVLSRSQGVDLVTGQGLDYALAGADAVIDVASVETLKASAAVEFFTAATGNLVSAAADAGVGHVVLLSIVGIDRIPYDYYAGKVAQEKIVEASRVPWTILRATQFHEFAGQMFARAKLGPLHVAPNARTQPVAAGEVGERLATLASGVPQGRVRDLAGPREERLAEMVRAFARREGYRGWVPALNVPGPQMAGMRAGHALPGPDADLGRQTFTEWLAAS
ncbi:SDR family oxidoreductase [Microbacterium sp. MYb62]|uniref:SDR family oxidoreductase n=1 Tax=Microbacterium sp. MYb62 TaxID=1848690 RepID=UPI000CFCD6CE|nr:SDR family oxidoreductase [Microbacterium sp. MYb62]PRB11297.1 3-beta hydroxysteroid dehydrogenase [Microbacterium sp. MYb62]